MEDIEHRRNRRDFSRWPPPAAIRPARTPLEETRASHLSVLVGIREELKRSSRLSLDVQ